MYRILITILGFAVLPAAAALAHWNEGDPHKMHYPQLPDLVGWDVMATQPVTLADDWLCSGTGPVSDIHFWGSWRGDVVGQFTNVHLSIHADVPDPDGTGPGYSRPGELLWSWDVEPTLIGNEPASPQGWFDPSLTGQWARPDHNLWFLYNIVNIPQPFIQQKGTIYWLDISVSTTAGTQWGWKTSRSPHFMDDAVWSLPGGVWQELRDPVTGESLDLAFVITPEPATLLMVTAGLMLIRRRR